MTSFISHYVQVNGIRTHYWNEGETGNALVLLHGWNCSVSDFEQNIETLSKTHRVFALDLLGHGNTEKPPNESYTLERQAQFVLDFMTTVGLEQAHLLGFSLGGRLALQCAAMKPQCVSSLILLAPGGVDDRGGVILELRLASVAFLGELLGVHPSKYAIRSVWGKVFFDPTPFVTDEFVEKRLEMANRPGAHQALLKCLRSFVGFGGFLPGPVKDIQAKMIIMDIPVFVIWGKEDRFISSEHHNVLAEKLPDAKVELFDRCGHAPHIECADLFHEKVLSFLKEV